MFAAEIISWANAFLIRLPATIWFISVYFIVIAFILTFSLGSSVLIVENLEIL